MIHSITAPKFRLTLVAAATSTALLLAACGGGGGSASTSVTPSQASTTTSSGTVTGFGSVFIDGLRIDDRNVIAGVEQENGEVINAELKLGQHVDIEYDDKQVAKFIRISSEATGIVKSVDTTNGTLSILGQTVVINTDPAAGPVTVFEAPYASLADIKVGQTIEVNGVIKTDAAGNVTIQATRIESEDPALYQRLRGHVSDLSTTAKTFKVGGLLVSYANAGVKPSAAALFNGADVVVSIDSKQTITTGTAVSAAFVKVKNHREEKQENHVNLGGAITRLDATAKTFVVDGVKVDASKALFKQNDRSFANLSDGVFVVVKGSYQADGTLTASTVVIRGIKRLIGREVELHGSILNYTSNANFTLRGVTIDASKAKIECSGTTMLSNNLQVEVEGSLNANGKLIATEVKCEENQQGVSIVERVGVASAVDTTARTLTLGNSQAVVYTSSTFFVNGLTPSMLSGKTVEVEGTLSGSVLTATKIKLASF